MQLTAVIWVLVLGIAGCTSAPPPPTVDPVSLRFTQTASEDNLRTVQTVTADAIFAPTQAALFTETAVEADFRDAQTATAAQVLAPTETARIMETQVEESFRAAQTATAEYILAPSQTRAALSNISSQTAVAEARAATQRAASTSTSVQATANSAIVTSIASQFYAQQTADAVATSVALDPNNPVCRIEVNSPLNFRVGPGTNYNVITTLSIGLQLPVTGRLSDNSWYLVTHSDLNWVTDSNSGWVDATFVRLVGSTCSNVPVIPPPRLATPNLPTQTPVPMAVGRPDLVITLLEGEEEVAIPSGKDSHLESYRLVVQNMGTARSGNFNISLQLRPDTATQTISVGNIPAGDAATFDFDYEFHAAGNFILVAQVDASDAVSEISEVNNLAQLLIVVRQQ